MPSRDCICICSIISLTSLPDVRDNHYIAQAQWSYLLTTPLFHGFCRNPFHHSFRPPTLAMKEADSSPLKRIRNDKSMKDCNRSQGGGVEHSSWPFTSQKDLLFADANRSG